MRKDIGTFRGKELDTGIWVIGYLDAVAPPDYAYIITGNEQTCRVDPETVGEFTGLTDKHGEKIFEGDIVGYFGKDFLNSLVTFDKGSFWFEFLSEYTRKIRNQKRDLIFSNVSICGEVIGNQYDNPEMLYELGEANKGVVK